jgi:hypothetical protein
VKRIFHTWDKWECYPAGFYEDHPPDGMNPKDATHAYAAFLRDLPRFERALQRVITEWKNSCEHYLSNENMNRIAWLGQAAMCMDSRVPAAFRSGFNMLSSTEQEAANAMAFKYLNLWLEARGEPPYGSMTEAASRTEMDLY